MGTHPIFESDFDCLTEMNFDIEEEHYFITLNGINAEVTIESDAEFKEIKFKNALLDGSGKHTVELIKGKFSLVLCHLDDNQDYLKFPVIKVATPFNLKLTVGEGPVNFVTDKLKYTPRRSKSSQSNEIKAELQNETVHFESIAESESPKRKRRRTTANSRTKGGTKYPELDEVLMKWMDLQPISPDEEVVVKQAQSFAKEIGVNGFSGTSSWSKAFFLRYKAHKADKLEVLSCSSDLEKLGNTNDTLKKRLAEAETKISSQSAECESLKTEPQDEQEKTSYLMDEFKIVLKTLYPITWKDSPNKSVTEIEKWSFQNLKENLFEWRNDYSKDIKNSLTKRLEKRGHHVKLEFVKAFSSWVKEKDSVNQKTIIEWLQSQKSEIKNDLRSLQD